MQAIRVRGIHLISSSAIDETAFSVACGHEPTGGENNFLFRDMLRGTDSLPLTAKVAWASSANAFTYDGTSPTDIASAALSANGVPVSGQTVGQVFPMGTFGTTYDDHSDGSTITINKYPTISATEDANQVVMAGNYLGVYLTGGYQMEVLADSKFAGGAATMNTDWHWRFNVVVHFDAFAPIP